MISIDFFLGPAEAQLKLAQMAKAARLAQNHTRETAAERSGVPASTLKRFERTGSISLEQLLMLCRIYGQLSAVLNLFPEKPIETMDQLLATPKLRKRGRK